MLVARVAVRSLPLAVSTCIPCFPERNAVPVLSGWSAEFVGPDLQCWVDAGAVEVVSVEFRRVAVLDDVQVFVADGDEGPGLCELCFEGAGGARVER